MRKFIADALGLSLDEAFILQKRYYHEFGTTLRGLMSSHGVDPTTFLDYVHDIDHSALHPAPELLAALFRLPGRRLIFTNGSEGHARSVLASLGLDEAFQGIFDIVAADYVPKPHLESYTRLIDRFGFDPTRAVFFEDIVRNLAPAAQLGMTTVLVRDPGHVGWGPRTPETDLSHIDFVTPDLAGWLETLLDGQPAAPATPPPLS